MDLFSLDLPDGEQKEFQIALVDEPAIERDWMAFGKNKQCFNLTSNGQTFKLISRNFSIESEDKRIISGYAMIADLEIPRYDEVRGAYNCVFRKNAIEKIWLNFQRNNLNTNTNIMHQTNQFAKGVFVCESIFLDKERGAKAHEGFTQESDGSWFISMKIENEEIWNQVKEGKFKGFSIEGRFTEEIEIFTQLKEIFKTNKMSKQTLKDKFKEFFKENPEAKEALSKAMKFEKAMLVDGTEVTVEPALEVGAAMVVMNAEGEPIPAPIGEYQLEDGSVVVVEVEGIIAEIKEPMLEEEEIEPIVEEPMNADSEQKVKRIIESIVKEKIFEVAKINAFLKAENETLKKDFVELQANFSKFKTEQAQEFESLKKFSAEMFSDLLDEPAQTPVKEKFSLTGNSDKKPNLFTGE